MPNTLILSDNGITRNRSRATMTHHSAHKRRTRAFWSPRKKIKSRRARGVRHPLHREKASQCRCRGFRRTPNLLRGPVMRSATPSTTKGSKAATPRMPSPRPNPLRAPECIRLPTNSPAAAPRIIGAAKALVSTQTGVVSVCASAMDKHYPTYRDTTTTENADCETRRFPTFPTPPNR
jgi:hypothetical protein